MLILARKVGEVIVIDDKIKIIVLEVKGGQVKLGLEAPDHVTIHREEVYQRITEENIKAANETPDNLSIAASIFNTNKQSTRDTKK